MFRAIFQDHPQSVGETYLQHQAVALSFSRELIVAGVACLVHALIPSLCVTTGSRAVARLHDRMIAHRVRLARESTNAAR
jgi:hypothetical protein